MHRPGLLRSALIMVTVSLRLLIPDKVMAAAHVELYTDSCTAGTDYFEFRLFITNNSTAGETLYLSSGTIRFTHGTSIVPSGTQSYDFMYQNGTCDPSIAPLYSQLGTSYNMNYNPATRLMQLAYSTGTLGNAYASVNAPVSAGQTICLGAFRLTITSSPWIDNQSVGFSWSGSSSGITAFEDTASVTTNMNTTANRTLGSMCSMTTPSTTQVGTAFDPSHIRIFPTVATAYLQIEGIRDGTMIHLVSIDGKRELSVPAEGDRMILSVAGLSKGVHFLEAGPIRRPFIVQ